MILLRDCNSKIGRIFLKNSKCGKPCLCCHKMEFILEKNLHHFLTLWTKKKAQTFTWKASILGCFKRKRCGFESTPWTYRWSKKTNSRRFKMLICTYPYVVWSDNIIQLWDIVSSSSILPLYRNVGQNSPITWNGFYYSYFGLFAMQQDLH